MSRAGAVLGALALGLALGPAPAVHLAAAALPAAPDGADCRPAATVPSTAPVGPALTERLRLPAAHALATGRGERIAVIDTGVAPHPRLAGRLVGIGDYLGTGDGLADCDGHGTAVAGIVAAAADPGDDLVGVAPDAEILAVRQFSPSLAGTRARPAGDLASLADALVRAVRAGADVVNVSGAVCVPAAAAETVGAALQDALDLAARADVVVVAAAGNAGGGGCAADSAGRVSLPGFFADDVLTVGAVDAADLPAPFTVRGPWVDVAAPGTGVRSLAVGGGTGAPLDGTSFAAPVVAGLAALVRERRPDLSARAVVDRITASARRPPGGRDDAVGAGVVDPVAALTVEPAALHPAPPRATATLTPSAPPPDRPLWPAGVAGLLAAAAGAALAATRPHAVSPPRRRRGPPPPRPGPDRWAAAAARTPGRARRS